MSLSSVKPTNRAWLQRLLSGSPHQVIGGTADPYMLRWYVIPRNPIANVYVHKFLRSDDDRALHDHPWWFVSVILRGGYVEYTEHYSLRREARSVAFRRAEHRHRVALFRQQCADPSSQFDELSCWTLIVTGPRRRIWGFWCKQQPDRYAENHAWPRDRFVPWTEFGDAGCGESS